MVLEKIVPTLSTIRYGIMDDVFHQTVAEHVFNMLELAEEILPKRRQSGSGVDGRNYLDMAKMPINIDHAKAVIMAHDLPEIGMKKDITSWEIMQNPHLQTIKDKIETDKIKELGGIYGSWLVELFNENKKQTQRYLYVG